MELICPHCREEIRLKQQYQYHAGFSNRVVLYCDSCPSILEISSYDYHLLTILGKTDPWAMPPDIQSTLESRLQSCSCGGCFRVSAPPRCPFCGNDISSLLKGKFYFIEMGEVVDADKDPTVWLTGDKG